ncbi:protein kinase family protein [Streptomyces sp. NRRL F-5123]|uniref:protein kinase family protein n=1 Tax=Streptomyces sp. NRRL F-5123 TaxID=1463856 RepID=UPI000AC97092|nr:protein kinase family protein [Streptomyces sp. NRRL F-5123]
MADRSTAAVEVADEGSALPDPQQDGTPDETPTDGRHGSSADGGTPPEDTAEGDSTTDVTAQQTTQDPDTSTGSETAAGTASGAETSADSASGADERPVEEPAPESGTSGPDAPAQAPQTATEPPADKPRPRPRPKPAAPDLHSGHRLARRYQLAECVTRVDGFSSWRAVDEKLRRAVGIHLLPAEHPRARQVLAAARSAALLGDPRFVQVLDAVEEDELVYVIHEWLPDAISLADLLASGPLEPHETYQMASQVSQGMAAAHREGLAHLRLDPGAVLRTSSGQYRIRGLAVAAALRGLNADRPQRQDTEAIGALIYASLTQRWPYEDDAHGLSGLPKGVGLVAPDQLRAGVNRALSDVAMRALVNDGATASREEPPCTTPEELAKAIAGIPRIRPPEHPKPVYRQPAFQQPPKPPANASLYPAPEAAPAPPPALPGRTGSALKWAVSALLIVAIGLGSWQLADALKSRENSTPTPTPTPTAQPHSAPPPAAPVAIVGAKSFDPQGDDGVESPKLVGNAYDKDASTYWETNWYSRADLGGLKDGVGLVLDLGSDHRVTSVTVDLGGGDTDLELRAAASGTGSQPADLSGFSKVASGSGDSRVTLKPASPVTTRYLLVWLTKLPPTANGDFRGKISEISVIG